MRSINRGLYADASFESLGTSRQRSPRSPRSPRKRKNRNSSVILPKLGNDMEESNEP